MRLPSVRLLAAGLGTAIVAIVLVAGLLAPWITPYDPFITNLDARMIPPSFMEGGRPENFLGTDQLGRDYFSRLIYGARISMLIGIATVITSGLIGITLGVLGGFFGGRVDDVVMFAITCRLSIPLILVALAVVGLVGSSLTVVVLTLGLAACDSGVDSSRIENTKPGEWLTYGLNYEEQRYSPLTQVNKDSVGKLGLAWWAAFDTDRGQEATPLVHDGVL